MAQMRRRVLVVDHDPAWADTFEALRRDVWAAVCDVALSVEHVGSTAVPGLAAKPVIDMDVVVASRVSVPEAVARLGALGYAHQGNLGIEGREAFAAPPGLPAHHLYVCIQGGEALANHLALRDFLRRSPAAAAEYGRLKKALAAQFPEDVDSYVAGKTDYILRALRDAGLAEALLQAIGRQLTPQRPRGGSSEAGHPGSRDPDPPPTDTGS